MNQMEHDIGRTNRSFQTSGIQEIALVPFCAGKFFWKETMTVEDADAISGINEATA